MEKLLHELQSIRKARKMCQSELGKKLNLPQSHISKIESGNVDPRLSTVLDIARMLGHDLVLIPREYWGVVEAIIHGKSDSEPRFKPDELEDE